MVRTKNMQSSRVPGSDAGENWGSAALRWATVFMIFAVIATYVRIGGVEMRMLSISTNDTLYINASTWFNGSVVAIRDVKSSGHINGTLSAHFADSVFVTGDVVASNFNGTYINSVNISNQSEYWDELNTPADLNYGILINWNNITGRIDRTSNLTNDDGFLKSTNGSVLNYAVKSYWNNISDARNFLSNFTNDLGYLTSANGSVLNYAITSHYSNITARVTHWSNLTDDNPYTSATLNATIDARDTMADTNETDRVNYAFTHWLNDTTTFSGEVSGTYNSLSIANAEVTDFNVTGTLKGDSNIIVNSSGYLGQVFIYAQDGDDCTTTCTNGGFSCYIEFNRTGHQVTCADATGSKTCWCKS